MQHREIDHAHAKPPGTFRKMRNAGNNISAFDILVRGYANIDRARLLVGNTVIPGMLPELKSRLQAEVRAFSEDALH